MTLFSLFKKKKQDGMDITILHQPHLTNEKKNKIKQIVKDNLSIGKNNIEIEAIISKQFNLKNVQVHMYENDNTIYVVI